MFSSRLRGRHSRVPVDSLAWHPRPWHRFLRDPCWATAPDVFKGPTQDRTHAAAWGFTPSRVVL